jgi:hypothetical protein
VHPQAVLPARPRRVPGADPPRSASRFRISADPAAGAIGRSRTESRYSAAHSGAAAPISRKRSEEGSRDDSTGPHPLACSNLRRSAPRHQRLSVIRPSTRRAW